MNIRAVLFSNDKCLLSAASEDPVIMERAIDAWQEWAWTDEGQRFLSEPLESDSFRRVDFVLDEAGSLILVD